jgi:hypothetical protein
VILGQPELDLHLGVEGLKLRQQFRQKLHPDGDPCMKAF